MAKNTGNNVVDFKFKDVKKYRSKKQQENSLLLFFLNHRADFVSYVVEVIKPNITH